MLICDIRLDNIKAHIRVVAVLQDTFPQALRHAVLTFFDLDSDYGQDDDFKYWMNLLEDTPAGWGMSVTR